MEIIKSYIESEPRLFGMSIIGSNPTKSLFGSQYFHLDNIEERSLRLIVLLKDIDDRLGPTIVINKKKSREKVNSTNYLSRRDYVKINDSEFNFNENDKNYLVGKRGDVFLLDTYSCLHMGGRVRSGQRLVFMATIGKGLFSNLRWLYNGKYDVGNKL